MKIGFFDSGLGGLTILKATRQLLPEYDYIYYGDTANLPYGDKTEEEIYLLTENAVKKLFDSDALLVIVACNTASAESVRRLQDNILTGVYADRKVLGVIIPTVEELVGCGAKRALLIGTVRTIHSNKYSKELDKISSGVSLTSYPTPLLVPLIEQGKFMEACAALHEDIQALVGKIDTLVLGCTHYTVLKETLREIYKIRVLSQDEIIPAKLQKYIEKHTEIKEQLSCEGTVSVVLSREDEQYAQIKKEFGFVDRE
ncbi:MAG: glutamate racemase [Candidatus Pacebacteria bacterium]|nr:glutamate racemase [Candidatus Paceibacterota bacterium]MCF7857107.1 glutamate racemase [Candidatus Paceibacterota bacterium]